LLALIGLGGDKPAAAKASRSKPASSPKPARERQPAANKSDREPKKKRAPRTHEPIEVTTPRLYVGNLSYDTTEEDLAELFNGVGGVESAEVVTHKQNQRSKGFAFVVLRSVEEAKRAVDVLHDKDFMGRKISVSGAKSVGPASR
jgi:RNA recognition motif-containing protein